MKPVAKQKIGMIYKVAAFLAFLMLGYLGLRGYRLSAEKLKVNGCIEEMSELIRNIQFAYRNEITYDTLEYSTAAKLNLIPKKMFKPGYSEAVNSYIGGVDMFYSSLWEEDDKKAFEISFQGLSRYGCGALMRMQWEGGDDVSFIAVGGYSTPMPSGVLDTITPNTKQEDIKDRHIFRPSYVRYASDDRINEVCSCRDDTCSVVWKFK